ncbi:hypothetical protein ACFLWZ_05200, partial [Chloroflexota bacterium]
LNAGERANAGAGKLLGVPAFSPDVEAQQCQSDVIRIGNRAHAIFRFAWLLPVWYHFEHGNETSSIG